MNFARKSRMNPANWLLWVARVCTIAATRSGCQVPAWLPRAADHEMGWIPSNPEDTESHVSITRCGNASDANPAKHPSGPAARARRGRRRDARHLGHGDVLLPQAARPGSPPRPAHRSAGRQSHQGERQLNGVRADFRGLPRLRKSARGSLPANHHAEILLLFLQEPLVRLAELLGPDAMRDEALEAKPPAGERGQQPALRLVDVPRAGQARVRRLEQHVAMRPGHLDVSAMQVVVEVYVLRLAARAADDDDLSAVARQ